MGLEWVLLSVLVAVALWLGLDACRESKRLNARLSSLRAERSPGRDGAAGGEWTYWPLTTASDDLRVGPRF